MTFFLIGILILVLSYFFNRDSLKIDRKAVVNFLSIMTIVTFLRLAILSFTHAIGINAFDTSALSNIQFWQFALVFWEDAFFAMSIYYIKDVFKFSKYIWIPFTIIISLYFGQGHLYQGLVAGLVSCIVPYYVFYKLGLKYGFGTTMLCHVLYDMITYTTVKLAPYIIN